MANRFKIKNDELTIQEFSEFLAFALKDLDHGHKLKVKMNLKILGAFKFSKNPFKRLIQKIKFYVRRHKKLSRGPYA